MRRCPDMRFRDSSIDSYFPRVEAAHRNDRNVFTVSASQVTTGQTGLERAWLTVRRRQVPRLIIGTAANVNDVTQAGALLHGQDESAFGDVGYRGVDKREEAKEPAWFVAMQPGKRRALDLTKKWARLLEKAEQLKAVVQAKVEHPFHVLKNLFGHRKVRYKGIAKNQGQLFSLFGLANLVFAKRSLLELQARGAP